MTQTIAQGSIAIKRMRRGYSLQMYFKNLTGVALYQGVDSAGNVSPRWDNVDDSQRPQIQPCVESTGNQKVTITNGKWSYLSVELSFGSDGKCTTSGYEDFFKLSTDGNYILTIIGNLADSGNDYNDVLTFSCDARVSGAEEQHLQGTVTVLISPIGADSWHGTVTLDTNFLTSTVTTATATLRLQYGTVMQETFGYAVVAAGTEPTASDIKTATNSKAVVADKINRDTVNGMGTFLAYFYEKGQTDPTKYVDIFGFTVNDSADDYGVEYRFADENVQQIDDGNEVVVTPYVVEWRSGSKQAVTTKTETWTHYIYHGSEQEQDNMWTPKRTVTGDKSNCSVTLTTDDSDYEYNGTDIKADVTVVSEVEFTI